MRHIEWDLASLGCHIDDDSLRKYAESYAKQAKDFNCKYAGRLDTLLADAVSEYSVLHANTARVLAMLYLEQSIDVTEKTVKAKIARIEKKFSEIDANFMVFFDIEIKELSDEQIELQCAQDSFLLAHKPWIDKIRTFKKHTLSKEVERALTIRDPLGSSAWSEFFDEFEADLRFTFNGEEKTLTEMLKVFSREKDHHIRKEAQKVINDGLAGIFAKYSAQTLYMTASEKSIENKERNYGNPMEARCKSNTVTEEMVEALHKTTLEVGPELTKRYYRLKAKVLKQEKLDWCDRNAPLPFADTGTVSFEEAFAIVIDAYKKFSPKLAELVLSMRENKWIDARMEKGRRSGAYNYSIPLPLDSNVHSGASFVFLNFEGSAGDIMTLAHELGHGVHGLLALKAQGPLMFHAPIAYCETASIFGEMTTFELLAKKYEESGNTEALLSLLFDKIDDMFNTTIRQISFSNFERRLHGMDESYTTWKEIEKYSSEELDSIWMKTTEELYGKNGEVFVYNDMDHLWAYISHFHRPFYVYGYTFGELLVQSLFAQKDTLGEKFEPLYIEMLESGMTKNVSELLKPFGLDPTNMQFWANGYKILERMIDRAEKILEKK